jgi:hypothetical protein
MCGIENIPTPPEIANDFDGWAAVYSAASTGSCQSRCIAIKRSPKQRIAPTDIPTVEGRFNGGRLRNRSTICRRWGAGGLMLPAINTDFLSFRVYDLELHLPLFQGMES